VLENAHIVHIVLIMFICINGVQTASFLYCDGSLMQDILPVAVQLLLCVIVRIEIHVWWVQFKSLCSIFVGACSVGFYSDLYYQDANVAGYIVFALSCVELKKWATFEFSP